jgi:hypothetical protein
MLARYRQWRHAGEENAVVVYSYSIGVELVAAVVMSAIFWFVFGALPELTRIALVFLYFIPVLAKRRIAIIFTESHLIYRPALATPLRIRLAGLQTISKGAVSVPWGPFNRGRVRGVVLQFAYAQSLELRLDLPHSDKIMQRLTDMTGIRVL